MEAPLKFRAPNVTVPMCLGIGRVVFRALNRAELVLAVIIVAAAVVSRPPVGVVVAFLIAFAALAVQLLVVRPRLNRRSDYVLSEPDLPHAHRSRGHYAYVGFELIKVAALVTAGILLLSSGTTSTTIRLTEGREPMESISLDSLAAEQLAEAQQHHSGRSAHTIYGGAAHHLRQTMVALRAGQALAEHDSPGEATLQVLRGRVRLTAGDETWEGKAGDYVPIPQTRHGLAAIEDSVVVLTVAKAASH
jgi:quercetin dioxygenase-like cupin family protein